MHAYTYSGHPTCCAVALENIAIIERERLIERAANAGARVLRGLRTLESLEHVGHVRGLGLIAGVEVVADKKTKQLFPAEAGMTQRLTDGLLAAGLCTRVVMDCICLAPPLVVTDDQIDRIVEALRVTIPRVVADVRSLPGSAPRFAASLAPPPSANSLTRSGVQRGHSSVEAPPDGDHRNPRDEGSRLR